MAFGEIDPASARQHARRFARILKTDLRLRCHYLDVHVVGTRTVLRSALRPRENHRGHRFSGDHRFHVVLRETKVAAIP